MLPRFIYYLFSLGSQGTSNHRKKEKEKRFSTQNRMAYTIPVCLFSTGHHSPLSKKKKIRRQKANEDAAQDFL
jgi:amino acid permease